MTIMLLLFQVCGTIKVIARMSRVCSIKGVHWPFVAPIQQLSKVHWPIPQWMVRSFVLTRGRRPPTSPPTSRHSMASRSSSSVWRCSAVARMLVCLCLAVSTTAAERTGNNMFTTTRNNNPPTQARRDGAENVFAHSTGRHAVTVNVEAESVRRQSSAGTTKRTRRSTTPNDRSIQLKAQVKEWCDNPDEAGLAYGPIAGWDVSLANSFKAVLFLIKASHFRISQKHQYLEDIC